MRTITVQCRKIGEEAWGTLNHFTAEHTQISELIGDDAKEAGYERLIAHARKTASNWITNYPQEWQVRVVDSATVSRVPVEPAPDHRFQAGDTVKAKASGKFYLVLGKRIGHPKLNGELGYDAVGLRGGERYGPVRLLRESAFEITVYGGDWSN